MATVQEFLEREGSSCTAFDVKVSSVPENRREVPGVVGEWSLKDVVWHCAYWSGFAADHLAMATDVPFADPFDSHSDEHWDGVNAEIAEASAAMSWDDVVTGAQEARTRLRTAAARASLAPEPLAWAADESWIHYDEHAVHVQAFADQGAG